MRGSSGGQARQLREDSFVLAATTQTSLKGLANPESANAADNKETINLALGLVLSQSVLYGVTAEYVEMMPL